MQKKAFPTIEDFEDTVKKTNENSKKAQEENTSKDNSKPALAKAIIGQYGKYVFIIISLATLSYKLIFEDVSDSKKSISPKINTRKNEIKITSIEKKGKIEVEDKASVEKILLKDGIRNKDTASDIQIPTLNIPTVPNLNNEIKLTEEKDFNKEKENEIKKEESRNNEPPTLNTSNKPELILDNKDSDVKVATTQNANNSNINSANGLFIVNTGGGAIKKSNMQSRLARGGTADLIILDSSLISVKEGNIDQDTSSITRISNLSNTISTGKMIEVVLETAINSEKEGNIRGVVTKDVYGEMGDKILIPAGSRVYGSYSSELTAGQSRLAVSWTKLLRPDGLSISMNAQATDSQGRTGISGNVDSRYMEMVKNSIFFSFITLGTAIATEKLFNLTGQSQVVNNNGSVATSNITPGNAAAQSLIQTATAIAKQMASQFSETVKPIVRVDQGTIINLNISSDLQLPSYKKKEFDIFS